MTVVLRVSAIISEVSQKWGKVRIKPSGMDKGTEPAKHDKQQDRPGRGKIRPRVIVKDRILSAAVRPGSRFKLNFTTFLRYVADNG